MCVASGILIITVQYIILETATGIPGSGMRIMKVIKLTLTHRNVVLQAKHILLYMFCFNLNVKIVNFIQDTGNH